MADLDLEQNFIKLIEEVVANSVTDIHIGSENFPYVRVTSRDVQPVQKFGKISHEQLIDLIMFMNPAITREQLDAMDMGINYIYEYQ